ncbi:16S rRNA (cytidine(1402)-2'-O)-methyltransferase [Pelagibacteraceae bacterium]|nr:16S rRNA (cytidine(1402)-2'-O)-methyltransferase [Pelagibacteraceae bacterium]
MNNFLSGLYIVSTPIGNLEDITLRALNVLKNSDKVLCEDTRRSVKLLNHYNISKQLVSNHKFNEKKTASKIVEDIKSGQVVSMISDAGTPTISDPGLVLINECIKNKVKIFPVPGVSAATTAMSVSGFKDQYIFYGFLPKKQTAIEKELKRLKEYKFSLIFFIPAIKINFYIKIFKKYLHGREVFIGREMTKIHETFYRDELDKFSGFKENLKGELTVIISGKSENYDSKIVVNTKHLNNEIKQYLKKYSVKDVVNLISQKNNLSKKKIYDICLKLKKT